MKKILCPTDFSKTAAKAIDYAAFIAQGNHSHLTLLHVIHLPVVDTSDTALVASEMLGDQRRDALGKLEAIRLHLQEKYGTDFNTGWTCDFLVEENLLADAVKVKTREEGYDLVVMGTTGGGNTLEEILIGSNTEAVMEDVQCPVLAIPSNAPQPHMRKIVYASDFQEHDLVALQEILAFARPFGAQVEVVHVNEERTEENTAKITAFQERLSQTLPGNTVAFHEIIHPKEDIGLKGYLTQTNSDILVIMRKRRNFFRDLFRQSLAEKLTYQTKLPLLVIHEKK